MKNSTIYFLFNQYKILLAALVLLFLTVVVLQVNYNKNHLSNFTVDEYYTIATIHPRQTPEIMSYRALNGPRMFTYLFYPGALIGMINHMGGNIYEESWQYPGHKYFVKHYNTSSSGMGKNMKDPNLRYLHYYLTLESTLFMFLSFLPLIFYLWKQGFYVALFMMSTLIGINVLMLHERSVFYIEPLLVSMLNIVIWLYLYIAQRKEISWFWVILVSFIFAVTISLKFSCIFILALTAVMLCSKFKSLERRLTAIFSLFLCTSLFFVLINWDLLYSKKVFNSIIHDYLSNFYQYATGNLAELHENYKWNNFKGIFNEILTSLGGTIFLFPLLLILGMRYTPRQEIIKWGGLAFVILLSVALIINQRAYHARNILPFLPALVLLTGVMLDRIFRVHLFKKIFGLKIKPMNLFVILIAIILIPILVYSKDYAATVLPNAKKNIEKQLDILQDKQSSRLVTIDYSLSSDKYKFKTIKKFSSVPETNATNLHAYIKNTISNFKPSDVVVISEINNNKQLTNYVLPAIFNTNRQYGNYFIFFNKRIVNQNITELEEAIANNNALIVQNEPNTIREDLILRQIALLKTNDSLKIYFTLDFLSVKLEDLIGCRFYFHAKAYNKDVSQLPASRIRYGYDNWDFTVNQDNSIRIGNQIIIWQNFKPTLNEYQEFKFGIFNGCAKSEEIIIKNVHLK